jgi:hypothetical protein
MKLKLIISLFPLYSEELEAQITRSFYTNPSKF